MRYALFCQRARRSYLYTPYRGVRMPRRVRLRANAQRARRRTACGGEAVLRRGIVNVVAKTNMHRSRWRTRAFAYRAVAPAHLQRARA